jgi:hypothetical protein
MNDGVSGSRRTLTRNAQTMDVRWAARARHSVGLWEAALTQGSRQMLHIIVNDDANHHLGRPDPIDRGPQPVSIYCRTRQN